MNLMNDIYTTIIYLNNKIEIIFQTNESYGLLDFFHLHIR